MRESTFWSTTFTRGLNYYAITIFAILWVGFAAALVVNPAWLDTLWGWVRELPAVAEFIVWVLFLPMTVGLWIWESSWSDLLRLLGLAGIIGWTLIAVANFVRTVR